MITLEFVNHSRQHWTGREEIRINCNECDDDKGHMYCNISKMVYICHKCGAKGKIQSEYKPNVKDFEKVVLTNVPVSSFVGIENRLVQVPLMYSPKVIRNLPYSIPIDTKGLYKGLTLVEGMVVNGSMEYLYSRGVTTGEISRYDIRCSLEKSGIYKNTIIFPIWEGKALKYFVARKYDESKPKYANAPWPKDDTLFLAGHNRVSYRPVICEGIFDALAIARVGHNAIALLGKIATKEQLYRLFNNHKKVTIYLDFDAFTQAIQLKLQLMALGIKSEIIKQTHDAADLYVKDKKQLEVELNEAYKRLTSIKEQ